MSNKALIITNIVILSCVIVGLLVLMFWGVNGKFNFYDNKKILLESKKFNISDINKLTSDVKNYDIKIMNSDSEDVIVEVYGSEKNKSHINLDLNNKELKITQSGSTFCFGFCFYDNEIIVYLPSDLKNGIDLLTVSGDIFAEVLFNQAEVSIKTVSSDIKVNGISKGDIKSTSGDILIDNITDGVITTVSGDISISKASNIKASSTSGEIEIKELEVANIKTTSGDIELDNFRIKENSKVESVSGYVNIRLLNEAYVDAETKSGDKDIKVMRNSKYDLVIKTISGDITVK